MARVFGDFMAAVAGLVGFSGPVVDGSAGHDLASITALFRLRPMRGYHVFSSTAIDVIYNALALRCK
jgi:hypothetical protein